MKKLCFLMLLGIIGLAPLGSTAQVSLNVNIGSQPVWGPTGYDRADYYYLPEVESYYYVPTREFIYQNNGKWIFSSGLPSRYNNYDLYNGYKVVINSPKPYRYFSDHKVKYAKFKGNRSQPIILKSNNPKYYVVKGHPKHNGKVSGRPAVKHAKENFKPGKGNSGKGSKGKGKN